MVVKHMAGQGKIYESVFPFLTVILAISLLVL